MDEFKELVDNNYTKAKLLGSFLMFARVFYELKTGREFIISKPMGREPHVITIARELKAVFNLQTQRLLINVPPGHHKSTLVCLWIAWCYANYPDCNFLYISISYELAEKHTSFIKEVMEMPLYKELFGVHLRGDSKAKGKFKTEAGGTCAAFGAKGAVVGNDGGLPNLDRFSGAIVMDDMHNPDETFSDTMREAVITNFKSTIEQRARGINVPFLFIGQRLHEADLPAFFIDRRDGYEWKHVILTSLDAHDNVLYPEAFPKEMLLLKREHDPYNFWAQHMQLPQPAGGGIFKTADFISMPLEPEMIASFLTIDTAETADSWNDSTAMSFFGIYKISFRGIDSGLYGLHWLDCREVRLEPRDLETEFFDFYTNCMRFRVKPTYTCIEKKSVGVTMCSTLKNIPGVRVIEIDRNSTHGNKTKRYYEIQPFVARHQVTFTQGAKHADMCIKHMGKITGNMSHAHDDIADTLEMAVRSALIEGTVMPHTDEHSTVLDAFQRDLNKRSEIRHRIYR